MPEMNVRERMRQRLEEARQRVRGQGASGQILGGGLLAGGKIGGGKLIEAARRQVQLTTTRMKERKPGVLPAVTEAIQRWQPGQRLRELLPESGGAANLRGDDTSDTGKVYNLRT